MSRQTRRLRSDGACHNIPNIFNSQQYSHILPNHVYQQITRTPSINCDRINQLAFQPGANHRLNLAEMKKALSVCKESHSSEINSDNYSMNNQDCSPEDRIFQEEEVQLKEIKEGHIEEEDANMKKMRKFSDSGNGQENLFGQQIMGNMNFLKELDQFLLE